MSNLPPAYLFVVRHGNRLDAADKKWHLTSPTPYDPPLTYGGFLQARQVGNQIASFLAQAKLDSQVAHGSRPKRFKVVIHSSPFLRCVQTSIGICSGLAQTSPNSIYSPSDIIVPRAAPTPKPLLQFKSALLRLDSFLGEWMSPEYFEMITPPPGPALMLGGAKAELLRREDYSAYTDLAPREKPPSSSSLWQASPDSSPANGAQSPVAESNGGAISLSALTSALPARPEDKGGYAAPRPMYAVSASGKIPDGFVAHARDACATVDYQWDSMREPLDFGDGGKFGEEWTAMHRRFRRGLRKLVNWYATTESPAELVAKPVKRESGGGPETEREDEQVETVVVVVSHGAGCNALIGAITHQPVLMDVAIASITMAVRKPGLHYTQMLAAAQPPPDASAQPLVHVDKMYDIWLSASTEHLQSTSSTPASSRSASTTSVWGQANHGPRGRTSTLGSGGGPVMSPFTYIDSLSSPGSRSSSASAALGNSFRRDSGSHRPLGLGPLTTTAGVVPSLGNRSPGLAPSFGLWSPVPSSLRLMDDGGDDSDEFGSMLPDFDQKRFQTAAAHKEQSEPEPRSVPASAPAVAGQTPSVFETDSPSPKNKKAPKGPVLAAPIKIHTSLGSGDKAMEEVTVSQLGGGLGGLWGQPPPPDEAERFRDLSHTKRRWTVNERV